MKKSVLMVCYYYPPLADVGCKRSVAFSKYFKKYGWKPFVISVKNPDKAFCSIGDDKPPHGIQTDYAYSLINPYKFLGKVNGALSRLMMLFDIKIERNYFLDIFCIPDIFFAWIPLTIIKGFSIIKKNNIDLIYVSCSPFSSAIIGIFLKILTGKPLILDFRDPYALKVTAFLRVFNFRIAIDRYIETTFLKHADIFVVTSDETKRAYIDQYPMVRNKIYTVYNGFEAQYLPLGKVDKFHKFTIVYAGEFYFYAPQNSIYTKIFFEALALLKAAGKINKSNFQFLFYGGGKPKIESLANEYAITDLVNAHLRISYQEVLDVVARSHLQLLRIIKLMISTKFFEGISLNIPFLATIPAGEVEGIIKKYSPSSYIITDGSADRVAEAIVDAMAKYEKGKIKGNRIREFLEEFSREALAVKLMTIVEERLQ